jgi:type II secretory pathway pseudopilin PulG
MVKLKFRQFNKKIENIKKYFYIFNFLYFYNKRGQSLIEVIVAISIFALVSATLVSMVVGGYSASRQGGQSTEAEALAEQGIEAVRAIRDGAWNKNIYATSAVEVLGAEWAYTGEGSTEIIGDYTRTISFNDVCRNSSQDIVDCPGDFVDAQTKQVVAKVSWMNLAGGTNSVEKIAYITDWDSGDWIQDTTSDFTGTGYADDPIFWQTASSTTMGDGNGAVVLSEQEP